MTSHISLIFAAFRHRCRLRVGELLLLVDVGGAAGSGRSIFGCFLMLLCFSNFG